MKNALGGKIMTEFLALRPKIHSYLIDDADENKANDTQKYVIKTKK